MAAVVAKVQSTSKAVRNGAQVLDVQADAGGGDNFTPEHFGPSGDDSPPLPGDALAGVDVQGSGRSAVAGYADPTNPSVAKGGEVRRYSRDEGGDVQATFHLMGDGSIEIASMPGDSKVTLAAAGAITLENSSGSIVLEAGGAIEGKNAGGSFTLTALGEYTVKNQFGSLSLDLTGLFTINGAQITLLGDVISQLQKSLSFHTHAVTTAPGTTGPPL